MKKMLLIIGSVLVVIAVVVACVAVYIVNTPEYAMARILEDVKSSGLDGLRPHLTGDAQEKLDKVTALSEKKWISVIMGLLAKRDYAAILKSEMKDVKWEVRDIMKGRQNAEVIIGFNFEDRLIGTIAISMVREERTWKIDRLEMPVFETVDWQKNNGQLANAGRNALHLLFSVQTADELIQ